MSCEAANGTMAELIKVQHDNNVINVSYMGNEVGYVTYQPLMEQWVIFDTHYTGIYSNGYFHLVRSATQEMIKYGRIPLIVADAECGYGIISTLKNAGYVVVAETIDGSEIWGYEVQDDAYLGGRYDTEEMRRILGGCKFI